MSQCNLSYAATVVIMIIIIIIKLALLNWNPWIYIELNKKNENKIIVFKLDSCNLNWWRWFSQASKEVRLEEKQLWVVTFVFG